VAEEKTSDMANDSGQAPPAPAEPQRTADIARLDLTRLRIEDGVKLDTVFERVTETAADILNVERVGVWLMVDHRRALRCLNLYERSKKSHSAGVTLQVKDFPGYRILRRPGAPQDGAGRDCPDRPAHGRPDRREPRPGRLPCLTALEPSPIVQPPIAGGSFDECMPRRYPKSKI